MKRQTLEATDEIILNSIKENTYYRNSDVRDFIETLDKIEGNMFISLDARWGEGKTFYVRQIEMSLEYLTKRQWDDGQSGIEDKHDYFKNTALNSIVLEKSYFPIYYNAWLYDNHDDPLMSLILTIIKRAEGYWNTQLTKKVGEKLIDLFNSSSISIGPPEVQLSIGKTKGKDILESIKTAEQIREMVKGILNEVIEEKAQRLVIFIDELDRCRPSYAIEMLERIKHYFDDERIIFIVSVNKEQLVHTISKCYGQGFDSSGYLNKFFDLNAHMPLISTNGKKNTLFETRNSRQVYFVSIADGLNDYFKLTLRDSLIYKQRLFNISPDLVNDYNAQGCCLSLFIPLIVILDMVNQDEKKKFLNGESNIVELIAKEIPSIKRMISRFGNESSDREKMFQEGLIRFMATYTYVFKELDAPDGMCLDVNYEMKRLCIKLCNLFEV